MRENAWQAELEAFLDRELETPMLPDEAWRATPDEGARATGRGPT